LRNEIQLFIARELKNVLELGRFCCSDVNAFLQALQHPSLDNFLIFDKKKERPQMGLGDHQVLVQ